MSASKCSMCNSAVDGNYKRCVDCRQYHLDARKKRIAKWAFDGKCLRCGRDRESGKQLCSKHTSKVSIYSSTRRVKLKELAFIKYGKSCNCCGESLKQLLTIDHVNNDGAQHRRVIKGTNTGDYIYQWLKNNNYPSGFQTMCFNCNSGRQINGGICPHESTKQIGISEGLLYVS